MSNETTASKEPLDLGEMPFYGITSDGKFVETPKADYPYRSLELYREQPDSLKIELSLYPFQLEVIRASLDAHMNLPEEERPSYFVIRVSDLQIIYASPLVTRIEDASNLLLAETTDFRIGPFSLVEAYNTWLPSA